MKTLAVDRTKRMRYLEFFDPETRSKLQEDDKAVRIRIELIDSERKVTGTWCGFLGDFDGADLGVPGDANDLWRIEVALAPSAAEALGLPRPQILVEDQKVRTQERLETARISGRFRRELGKSTQHLNTLVELPGGTVNWPDVRTEAAAVGAALKEARTKLNAAANSQSYPLAQSGLQYAITTMSSLIATLDALGAGRSTQDVLNYKRILQEVERDYPAAIQGPKCEDAYLANVQMLGAAKLPFWLMGGFEIPTYPGERVVEVPDVGVTFRPARVSVGDVAAWFRSAPAAKSTYFNWVLDDSPGTSGLSSFGQFLVLVFRHLLIPSGAPQDSDGWLSLTSEQECLKALDGRSLKVPLEPLARFESRVSTTRAGSGEQLKRGRTYTVHVCTTDDCLLTGNKESELGTRKVQAPRAVSVTLLGAFTYDLDLKETGGRFPNYQWVPVSAVGTTQQLYRLENVPVPLQSISASLLLAVLIPVPPEGDQDWRIGFGLGPNFLTGAGVNALYQWTANILVNLPFLSDKLLFSLGGGVRFVPVPDVFSPVVGATVAVDRTASGQPATPGISTQLQTQGVLSIGLALDLAVLGDAATSIFGVKAPAAPAAPGSAP